MNTYFLIPFALCASSALFARISASFGKEVVLFASVHVATYYDSAGCDMKNRNATADD
jgi:hypothetical protein